MGNALEFILKLQDMFSTPMKAAGAVSDSEAARIADDMNKVGGSATSNFKQASSSADNFKHHVKEAESGVGELFERVKRIGETFGIYLGFHEIVDFVKESKNETMQLNQASAQLANTLKNNGQYSKEAFKEIINGSSEMSEHILFSKGQVIELQSQLRLVGNIGEANMKRMVEASADMATKFHMNLNEAGNAIAKAVNDPEMMRRLGQTLKIDPAIQQHIQDLAKHGKEAAAQLELLNVVEGKVGGAAAAAFNADPLAQFSKTMEEIRLRIGNVALWLETKLASAFNTVTEAVKSVIAWMEQHKTLMEIVGVVVGIVTTAIIVQYTWIGLVAGATKAWAAVQWLLNSSMLANPITWIIAAIIALIAAIGYVIYTTKGWGQQWKDIMNFFKFSWASFKDYFMLVWLNVQDGFMTGIELIEKGWYHLKSLWDKDGAAAGLSKINDEQNKRAEAIAKQKGVLASDVKAAEASLKWDISSNGKTLGDLTSSLKKKLGFSTPMDYGGGNGESAPGGNYAISGGKDKADAINSGGQRNITINVAKQQGAENVYVMSSKDAADDLITLIRGEMRKMLFSVEGAGNT